MKCWFKSSFARSRARGFTLIELMIVVAVVAILAALAYPSYMESVRRGWRAEARTALMREMQQQERFYTQRGKYKEGAFFKASGESDASSKYDIEVAGCGEKKDATQCLRLTAKLRPGLSDDLVGDIWIESTGTRGCNGKELNRCWQ